MIIANGTIAVKQKSSGGGIDPATGFPLKPASSWEKPIPCQFKAVKFSYLGRSAEGSAFTLASYEILIEASDNAPFKGEQIRLVDEYGSALGEFSIVQVEPLRAVCQTKIIV